MFKKSAGTWYRVDLDLLPCRPSQHDINLAHDISYETPVQEFLEPTIAWHGTSMKSLVQILRDQGFKIGPNVLESEGSVGKAVYFERDSRFSSCRTYAVYTMPVPALGLLIAHIFSA